MLYFWFDALATGRLPNTEKKSGVRGLWSVRTYIRLGNRMVEGNHTPIVSRLEYDKKSIDFQVTHTSGRNP